VQGSSFHQQGFGLVSSSRQNQRQGFSVRFWFAMVLKGCVSFLAKVTVGFAGSQNWRVFCLQSFE